MSIFLVIMLFAVLFYVGSRSMRKNGYYRDVICYAILIGCCTYLSISKPLGWPSLHGFPLSDIFLTIGKHIQLWIGGPPSE